MIAHQKHEAVPLLSVRGLCVRFGNGSEAVAALRNLSFDLGKEKLGIVEKSGSGKSTLGRAILKLLPRMATIFADRLDFCGSDIGKATERQMLQIRGRQIGMILQDPKYALDPTMKIGDQIGEAVTLHLGKRGKDKKSHVLEMLDSVKIRNPQRVYELYPHQISGGMGQRIMIAITLVAQPKIIIADEPTSALDVTVRRQLLELLDELVTARGIGLIFITHDLDLAEGFCDRLLIMYSGQILEELPASSLSNAKHPYTQGLLESMPRLEAPTERLSVLVRDPRVATRRQSEPFVMIEVENINLAYGHGKAAVRPLNGVSFKIEKGEAFGIVGESGCGKSSLLRCIGGLETGWKGRISIGGFELSHSRKAHEMRVVQMVFQDPYGTLHPRHTIGTALFEPLRAQGMPRSTEIVEMALSDVGLGPSFRTRYPHQLSGGQRQRVAIARALIVEPDVVLLDEPTSALDVSVQAEILNLLSELRKLKKLTYILVSHDLAVTAHMCSRLVVMNSGKIVEELTADDLRNNNNHHPYTRELIESSQRYKKAAA